MALSLVVDWSTLVLLESEAMVKKEMRDSQDKSGRSGTKKTISNVLLPQKQGWMQQRESLLMSFGGRRDRQQQIKWIQV